MATENIEASASSQSVPIRPSARGRAAGRRAGSRWIWLVASGICLAAATSIAFLQPPHPDPTNSAQRAWQWFKEPIERNAWWRLPRVNALFLGVYFSDSLHGWAVGSFTIVATKNGGATWELQKSDPSKSFISVYFADVSRGWAVGYDGVILATSVLSR